MKKTLIIMIGLLSIGLLLDPFVTAETFDVTATIPSAQQVVFIVSRAQDGGEFTEIGQGSTALNFDQAGEGIEYDSTNQIWVASRYFVIDLSPQTLGGDPAPASFDQITFNYSLDNAPDGATSTLADKGTVTVVRVDTVEDPQNPGQLIEQETPIVATTFGNVATTNVTNADVAGGFMRTYVAISTGEAGTPGVPFTNGDAPGTYSGRLTISATLL